MKLTVEIPDTYMLNMLCNASYRDYTAIDGELEKAYNWIKFNPEAVADLDMPECWEPQIFAYLRANAEHHVLIADEFSDGVFPLTWDSMCKAMQKMAQDYPHHFDDLIQQNDDAHTADAFLQLSLFGDVIYG
jgi:hypothetical protein